MTHIVNVLRGVAIGLANIIPGVSGGTMALVLGIYERLIRAIHNLGPRTVLSLFRGKRAFVEELRRADILFLGTLGLGAGLAVVSVAKVMVYLLQKQHDATYGFFFGLVLVSVLVPYKLIRRHGAGTWIAALAGIAAVVALSMSMSGPERVASERRKAEIKARKAEIRAAAKTGGAAAVAVPRVPEDPRTLAFFFAAGALAISAMILPGISGSFLMLVMGVYFDLLTAINARQLVLLGVFALGCGIGLLAFTRLLNLLLEKAHDVTMAFLMGLVVGSLYAIWPFKRFEMVAGKRIDLEPVLPASFGANEAITLAAVLAGCAVVVAFMVVERRQGAREAGG